MLISTLPVTSFIPIMQVVILVFWGEENDNSEVQSFKINMCIKIWIPRHLQYFELAIPNSFPGGSGVKASARNAGGLGSIPGSGRSPGEGNGNPLQYSCLESPRDGRAWQATVRWVTKSQTRLSDFTFFSFYTTCNELKKSKSNQPQGAIICLWDQQRLRKY